MDTDLDKIISNVTSIEMITEGLLSTLQTFGRERIVFKNLRVSHSEYYNGLEWLDEAYCERNHISMEYNEKTGMVIVNLPASAVHCICQKVFVYWLDEIVDSQPDANLVAYHEAVVANLRKTPDAALRHEEETYPIIAVEVGFTDTLDEMFDAARELFRHSHGVTQVVILLKIYEVGRVQLKGGPWGLTETEIRAKAADRSLPQAVVNWHKENNINVVGDLKVCLYVWGPERKHPPPNPIWEFKTGPSIGSSNEGLFRQNMRNPFLDHDFRLKILGGSFPLPVERIREGLKKAINAEMVTRVIQYLYRHRYLRKD
ncbi:hypothetical protein BDV59DRAFT_175950 [Aspergillus ambiguus]|uniref:uncharacterized protein n=1 Tax=Aspergillus ambiguus TaxID=176160 RepID=UPI003CCE4E18